jgi:hypothetical protein
MGMYRTSSIFFRLLALAVLIGAFSCGSNNNHDDVQASNSLVPASPQARHASEPVLDPPAETDYFWTQYGNTGQHARRSLCRVGGLMTDSIKFPQPWTPWSDDSLGEPVISSNGYIYWTDSGGALHCTGRGGAPVWTHHWAHAEGSDSTPAIDEARHRVFYTSHGFENGRQNVMLWCIDISDPWNYVVSNSWRIGHDWSESSPVIDSNGNVYIGAVEYYTGVGGPCDCYLVYIPVSLPAQQFESVRFAGQYASSPTVTKATGSTTSTVYIAYVDYSQHVTIFSYNPVPEMSFPWARTSGQLPTQGFGQSSPVLGRTGSIYYCMMEGLYKLDPSTLNPTALDITASHLPESYYCDHCTPAISRDGRIFVAEHMSATSLRMVGYDADLSRVLWFSTTTPDFCLSSPSLSADGYLFVQYCGRLVQLDTNIIDPAGVPPYPISADNPLHEITRFGSPSITQIDDISYVYTVNAEGLLVRNSLPR